jgi:hypothetical protein
MLKAVTKVGELRLKAFFLALNLLFHIILILIVKDCHQLMDNLFYCRREAEGKKSSGSRRKLLRNKCKFINQII